MNTNPVYLTHPYRREAEARVLSHTPEGGVICDASVFYPAGGGQPGDSGWISWGGQRLGIATALKGMGDSCVLVPSEAASLPPLGSLVRQELDWERRHRMMRMHTALHLLTVVIALPVTGGAIGA
ncbi:MAG: alanyl-tRNA editing protein, partial [Rhodobacterales bacterium]